MTHSIEVTTESAQQLHERLVNDQNVDSKDADTVLQALLELACQMFERGDIKAINRENRTELVCQVRKGSRRLLLEHDLAQD